MRLETAPLDWQHYAEWLKRDRANFPTGSAPTIDLWVTDSRSIGPGQWFVPIAGASYDGHRFIPAAMAGGAAGFLYEVRRAAELPPDLCKAGIPVEDTLAAFQAMMSGWRLRQKNLCLVALTGSSGKTTTKEMLRTILEVAGPTLATHSSFNNEIGVPKTLQQLKPHHRYAAVEFGARKPGDIRFLCELARPEVGVVLNVGSAHLEIFGNVESLVATKLEMFAASTESATLVAYYDDPRILNGASKLGRKVVSFGKGDGATVRLQESQWLQDGSMNIRLELNDSGKKSSLNVHMPVAHQVFPINAAAAAAAALAAGVSPEAIVQGLSRFIGVKGRYQITRIGRLTVIDDTYNANPESMAAGLETLARAYPSERKVVVLGDMLELGAHATAEHHKVGARAAGVQPESLLVVGALAEAIAEGAVEGGLNRQKIRIFPSIEALLEEGLDFTRMGDVLYAKASRGVRLDLLVEHVLKSKEPA